MLNRHRCRPKAKGKLVPCLISLNTLLSIHNSFSADKTKYISKTTLIERSRFYERIFRDLHNGGYSIDNVKKLKIRHIQYLVKTWVGKDLSASSFNNNLSFLRTFCEWIGKKGMINLVDLSAVPPEKLKRTGKATKDKDWSKDDDFWLVMGKVKKSDIHVYCQLLLMTAFGLRRKEAAYFKPYAADLHVFINIDSGTKGGKARGFQFNDPFQREVLDFAKSLVPGSSKSYSTTPRGYTRKKWKNHFYDVLRKNGILLKEGRVSHGLRHGFAHRMLEEKTGHKAPILSGVPFPKMEQVLDGKRQVSKALGHVRAQITDAYGG